MNFIRLGRTVINKNEVLHFEEKHILAPDFNGIEVPQPAILVTFKNCTELLVKGIFSNDLDRALKGE